MNLIYLVNARLPTEKAHGIQISKMCEAFSLLGVDVLLVAPKRVNPISIDLFDYYRIRPIFTFRSVSCPDLLTRFSNVPRLGFCGQALSFLWGLRKESFPMNAVILTRNPEIAWWYGRKGYAVFFDAHNFPMTHKKIVLSLLKYVAGIIANSRGTMEAFQREGMTNVIAVPNAVDLKQFTNVSMTEGHVFGLPTGRIAMYIGHLYGWKGADTVVEAARRSKDKDLTFVFVGGTERDLQEYRARTASCRNIVFLGHRTREEIPLIMSHADVLLLPNSARTQESVAYTSPIKMFEYMASGIPIVASDLPSLREILHDGNAILVQPDDPDALLSGIKYAFELDSQERALRAKEEVKEYTWDKRAEKILTFMTNYVRNHR